MRLHAVFNIEHLKTVYCIKTLNLKFNALGLTKCIFCRIIGRTNTKGNKEADKLAEQALDLNHGTTITTIF